MSKSDMKREKAYRRKQEKKKIDSERVIHSLNRICLEAEKVVKSLGRVSEQTGKVKDTVTSRKEV